jgi:hypothetical protein
MDSDQRWTKDRGMRGRLPTFTAVVIYGLISSFSSADVCRRLSTEPSHGENMGSSPLGSANEINNLFGQSLISVPKVSPRMGGTAAAFNWINHPRRPCWGGSRDLLRSRWGTKPRSADDATNARSFERVHSADQLQPRPNRTLGIVLMRLGIAEID